MRWFQRLSRKLHRTCLRLETKSRTRKVLLEALEPRTLLTGTVAIFPESDAVEGAQGTFRIKGTGFSPSQWGQISATISTSSPTGCAPATLTTDYTATNAGSYYFYNPGEQTITVSANRDQEIEACETVTLALAYPNNATIDPAHAQATIRILDAAPPPATYVVNVTATDSGASETGPDNGTFTISGGKGDKSNY